MTININPNATETQLVGTIPECIIQHYSIQCAGLEVYMPPGVLKHLQKRGRWKRLCNVLSGYTRHDCFWRLTTLDEALLEPDTDGGNIYKVVSDHVIFPIKLNAESGLFLSLFLYIG